jgi:hypothetical protein
MADELVRVRIGNIETNVGRVRAEKADLTILDESPYRGDGRPRRSTRKGGRPRKPKTSVAEKAAEKKAATAASEKAAAVAADDTAKEA